MNKQLINTLLQEYEICCLNLYDWEEQEGDEADYWVKYYEHRIIEIRKSLREEF